MNKITKKLIALAAVMAIVAMSLGFAPQAQAKTLDASTAGITVSDDITRLDVAKLDPDTREYVEGATMRIVEKDTGEVVDEWVTGSETHHNAKVLNVNVHYLLQEISAPDGYEVATETEFYVDETEGVGIHIVSGPDAELTESYKINLYDKKLDTTTETVVTKTTENTTTSKVKAPKTGDETPFVPVLIVVLVAIAGIVALQIVKKKQAKNQD